MRRAAQRVGSKAQVSASNAPATAYKKDSANSAIFHPLDCAARRAFCPFTPIALVRSLSFTITNAACFFLSGLIANTFAGSNAFKIKSVGFLLHS